MSPNRLSNLTIVVVEDHDDARRYLGLFLDRLGATVVVARNGFDGLEAIKNNRPDLVVSDIQMPGMDGFELLREIRALGSGVFHFHIQLIKLQDFCRAGVWHALIESMGKDTTDQRTSGSHQLRQRCLTPNYSGSIG